MEESRGGSITDLRWRDGKRLSVSRTYVSPYLDKPSLVRLS
jgi:hypothetical protein